MTIISNASDGSHVLEEVVLTEDVLEEDVLREIACHVLEKSTDAVLEESSDAVSYRECI